LVALVEARLEVLAFWDEFHLQQLVGQLFRLMDISITSLQAVEPFRLMLLGVSQYWFKMVASRVEADLDLLLLDDPFLSQQWQVVAEELLDKLDIFLRLIFLVPSL
jgi:hypothetical protein